MVLRPALAQLLMVDLGLGAAAAGVALLGATDGAGGVIGAVALIAAGAVLVLLAVARWSGRWLFQHALAWGRMRRHSRIMRAPAEQSDGQPAIHPALAWLTGGYAIESIPGPRQTSLGAVRCGATWSIALEIVSDDLLNEDVPVPLRDLPSLLRIEDVPLAQVRVLTFAAPPAGPAAGASAALPRTAVRLCVLTLDTRDAAEALLSRGGSTAALAQILRRCALRADETLTAHGLSCRPVDEAAMTRLLESSLGIPAPMSSSDGERAAGQERWAQVDFGDARSVAVALGGDAVQGLAVADHLLGTLPAAMAASALVLSPSAAGPVTTLVLRATSQADGIAEGIRAAAHRAGLRVDALAGRQRDALLLTVPLGAGA